MSALTEKAENVNLGLKVLNKITQKWGWLMYLGIEPQGAQVYKILKETKNCLRTVVGITKVFDIEVLEKLNAPDEKIQFEWKIAREIICKISHETEVYKDLINRLEIEIAGLVQNLFFNEILF
jgi:hypothetical protein